VHRNPGVTFIDRPGPDLRSRISHRSASGT
jgi:hypothetical protein